MPKGKYHHWKFIRNPRLKFSIVVDKGTTEKAIIKEATRSAEDRALIIWTVVKRMLAERGFTAKLDSYNVRMVNRTITEESDQLIISFYFLSEILFSVLGWETEVERAVFGLKEEEAEDLADGTN